MWGFETSILSLMSRLILLMLNLRGLRDNRMEKPSKAQTLRRESPGDRGVYNYILYTTVPGHTRDAVLAVVRESAG